MNRGNLTTLGWVLTLFGVLTLVCGICSLGGSWLGGPGGVIWDSGGSGSWDGGGWDSGSGGSDSGSWDSGGGWDSGSWDSGGGWDSGAWDSGGSDSGSW